MHPSPVSSLFRRAAATGRLESPIGGGSSGCAVGAPITSPMSLPLPIPLHRPRRAVAAAAAPPPDPAPDSALRRTAYGVTSSLNARRIRHLLTTAGASAPSLRTMVVTAATVPSASPAAAMAAAAVASAAAAGLGRGLSTKIPAAPVAAVAAARSAPSSSPTAAAAAPAACSPSTPAASTTLEGTPVPWVVLTPAPTSSSPSTASLHSSKSPSTAASASTSASASAAPPSSDPPLAPLDLIQQRFRIGGGSFRLLTPRDVDAVMDLYLAQGLQDADPYWTRAWPSAIALAATLLKRPELVRGKVVADLGSGLGLAGMAAAMAGAREVVLLDREPLALQCGLLSAAASGLAASDDCDGVLGEAEQGSTHGEQEAMLGGEVLGQEGRRWRRLVEPLPAEQLPSYASVQLEAAFRRRWEQQQQELEAVRGEGAGNGAGRDEWAALLALARSLHDGGSGNSTASSSSILGGSSDATGATASQSSGSSSSSSEGGGSSVQGGSSVLRAHVFDWTSPPAMERLLPPLAPLGSSSASASTSTTESSSNSSSSKQGSSTGKQAAAAAKQGPGGRQRRFDVVLACDVLYEDAAVGPISALMPLLLELNGGRLLLADPPNRTVRNRERFLSELRSGPLRLAVEECSMQQCEVSKLDNEMAGGLAPSAETVPVQFLVFRSCVGNDTVGVKLD